MRLQQISAPGPHTGAKRILPRDASMARPKNNAYMTNPVAATLRVTGGLQRAPVRVLPHWTGKVVVGGGLWVPPHWIGKVVVGGRLWVLPHWIGKMVVGGFWVPPHWIGKVMVGEFWVVPHGTAREPGFGSLSLPPLPSRDLCIDIMRHCGNMATETLALSGHSSAGPGTSGFAMHFVES